jgi:serine/threonine protein kinase
VANSTALQAGIVPYPGYRLRQRLGRGGFADVWEAETADGKAIALKFMPCDDSGAAAKEIRSIQAVRQLCHPNLIRIDQVWCYQGYVVVAMELADGSLLDLLEAYQYEFGSPIIPEQACSLLAQVATALDFLNARQHRLNGQIVAIQHCDVKPSNMLLFGETVKLADFGLSSQTTSQLKFHRRAGTLDYTAPEVLQGRLSDRTDQYALAVSYCLLRGGQLPFTDSPGSFANSQSYTRPAPNLSMLSEREQPIITRALSPVPQYRWPSCAELIAQLARLVV